MRMAAKVVRGGTIPLGGTMAQLGTTTIPGGSERHEALDMCRTVYMLYCSYVVFLNLV